MIVRISFHMLSACVALASADLRQHPTNLHTDVEALHDSTPSLREFRLQQKAENLRGCVERVRRNAKIMNQEREVMDFSSKDITDIPRKKNFHDIVLHELAPFTEISDNMIDVAFCDAPQTRANVKIIDGTMQYNLLRGEGTNADRAQASLEFLESIAPDLNNITVDMVLYMTDLSPDVKPAGFKTRRKAQKPHPIFVYQHKVGDENSIAFPEFDFHQNWERGRQDILEHSDGIPWHERTSKLFFRGGKRSGYRKYLQLQELRKNEDVDIDFSEKGEDEVQTTLSDVSHGDHSKHKYLLHLVGDWGSTAKKLKYILATGSAVLVPETDFYEFWTPLLRPYKHYVPVLNLYQYGGRDIPGIMECLKNHDKEAEKIGQNGQKFIRDVLNGTADKSYAEILLREYSARLRTQAGQSPRKSCGHVARFPTNRRI